MSDQTGEQDPLDSEPFVLVPLVGLVSDVRQLAVADLVLRFLDPLEWSNFEPSRITEPYLHIYAAHPRYFLIRQFDPEANTDAEVGKALQDASDLVLALRLAADWDLIAPAYVVWYLRQDGVTMRPRPDSLRSRFLTRTFGEAPQVKVAKSRTMDGVTDTYYDSVSSLGGELFQLLAESVPHAEVRLALVREYGAVSSAPDVDLALRNFSVGRSRLSSIRHRLVAMFTAAEAVFGGYRPPGDEPSLGQLVARSRGYYDETDEKAVDLFENQVRQARNALAHGSDRHYSDEWEAVWKVLSSTLRYALPVVMQIGLWGPEEWGRFRALPNPSSSTAPTRVFQTLLGRAHGGEEEATAILDATRSRLDP